MQSIIAVNLPVKGRISQILHIVFLKRHAYSINITWNNSYQLAMKFYISLPWVFIVAQGPSLAALCQLLTAWLLLYLWLALHWKQNSTFPTSLKMFIYKSLLFFLHFIGWHEPNFSTREKERSQIGTEYESRLSFSTVYCHLGIKPEPIAK